MTIYFPGKKQAAHLPLEKLKQGIADILTYNTEAFDNATTDDGKTAAFELKQRDIEDTLKAFLKENEDFEMQYNVVTPNFCTPALEDKSSHPRANNLIEFSKMKQVRLVFDYFEKPTGSSINPAIVKNNLSCNELRKSDASTEGVDKLLGETYTLYNPKTGERFSIGTSNVKRLPQAGEVSPEVSDFKSLAECIATSYSKNHEESIQPPLYTNAGTGKEDEILNQRSSAFETKLCISGGAGAHFIKVKGLMEGSIAKPKTERIEILSNYINKQDNIHQQDAREAIMETFCQDFLAKSRKLNEASPDKFQARQEFIGKLTPDLEGFEGLKARYSSSSRLQTLTNKEGVYLVERLKKDIPCIGQTR
jgi:hypothetical protein